MPPVIGPVFSTTLNSAFISWSISYSGTPGSGTAVLPAYIVTEDLIEYHWLTDANPRVFQLGMTGTLARQLMVVKFGAVVVKGANYAHALVNISR